MSDAATSPSPDVTTVAGSLIAGKYRVLKIIGSGGMGTEWEGVHMKLGTRVAIKLIRPQFAQQAEARARFEIEARPAPNLRPNPALHPYAYRATDQRPPYNALEFRQ